MARDDGRAQLHRLVLLRLLDGARPSGPLEWVSPIAPAVTQAAVGAGHWAAGRRRRALAAWAGAAGFGLVAWGLGTEVPTRAEADKKIEQQKDMLRELGMQVPATAGTQTRLSQRSLRALDALEALIRMVFDVRSGPRSQRRLAVLAIADEAPAVVFYALRAIRAVQRRRPRIAAGSALVVAGSVARLRAASAEPLRLQQARSGTIPVGEGEVHHGPESCSVVCVPMVLARPGTCGMHETSCELNTRVKKIGFLSFGHWSDAPGSQVRSGSDSLLQSIELAVAAEELGADGAYFRVHHFAQQLGSPFPLLAAAGARTKRIELGTAVIDMRYENPLYMAEDAGAADLIAGGRLQLGISRGSPEQVIDGWRYFGYQPGEGKSDADMARDHAAVFLEVLKGEGFAQPNPRPMFHNPPGLLRVEPHSEGLRDRIWWGAASQATAQWAAQLGMNLQSSTLITNESDDPFHVQQARQIQAFRDAWKEAGHEREPRVSVSRSIFALTDSRDRMYFGSRNQDEDHVGYIDKDMQAIFGRTYAAEPDKLIEQLKEDEAIAAADTLLLTVPNQLGVEYNAHAIESILTHVAPALGWR